MNGIEIGRIVIIYTATEDGDVVTEYHVEGQLPLVTQLGLLEMAKDTALETGGDDDDEE